MERLRAVMLGMAFAVALGAGPAPARDPAFGHWLVESGRAIVEIYDCGGEACGRIAWMAEPTHPDGRPKRDVHNPDPDARDRALCGMRLIRGLEAEEEGAWEDGQIYDSRRGRTFGVRIEAEAPDRLEVRGFLGLPALGRSQVWTRVPGDRGGCLLLRRASAGG